MNRLLSFNPEPFETYSELENVFQAYGATRAPPIKPFQRWKPSGKQAHSSSLESALYRAQ
jgi:hypothetical protein